MLKTLELLGIRTLLLLIFKLSCLAGTERVCTSNQDTIYFLAIGQSKIPTPHSSQQPYLHG